MRTLLSLSVPFVIVSFLLASEGVLEGSSGEGRRGLGKEGSVFTWRRTLPGHVRPSLLPETCVCYARTLLTRPPRLTWYPAPSVPGSRWAEISTAHGVQIMC